MTDGNGESRGQLSRRRNGVGELAGGMVQGSISRLGGSSGNEHREDGWRTPAQKGQMRYLGETPSTVRRHGPEYLGVREVRYRER